MCKQKTLTVAIASALIAGSGAVHAVDQFQNAYVGMTPTIHDSSVTPMEPVDTLELDATNVTLIRGEQYGVLYASELFGDGASSLQLPSGATTGIGAYAATVYTVDGTISKKFDMTFTLTNGATFASAPILTMDTTTATTTAPTDGNGYVSQDYSAGAENITIHPGIGLPTVGSVVQFGGTARLYKVLNALNTGTSNVIDIQQLGGSTGLVDPIDADPYPVSIYYLGANGVANTSIDGVGNTPITVTNTLSLSNVITNPPSSLYLGHTYKIAGGGGADAEYSVEEIDAGGNEYRLSPALSGQANALDNTITRAYVKGDDNIALVSASLIIEASNNTFQFAGHTTRYTFTGHSDSSIGGVTYAGITPPLTQAISDREEIYQVKMRGTGQLIAGDWSDALPLLAPEAGTGSGKSTAKFVLDATDAAGNGYGNLQKGTRIVLFYQLNNAGALANPGADINMQVSLVTSVDGILVNPAREVKVAASQKAISASLKNMDPGQIRVSVDSGSTAFTGTPPGPYVSATTAQIGYLDIVSAANIKAADGETDFELGKTGAEASASTLDIEEGQFAASVSENGRVFIDANNVNIDASNVTETTAHWDLTNSYLETISDAPEDTTKIKFTADGEAVINTGLENPPSATLKIDFDSSTTEDIIITAELTQIKQDGTVCTLYNVPPSGAQDEVNIRITNESTSSDDLTCTLVDTAGATVLDAVPCFQDDLGASVPIGPMETKRLTSADLEALGATWGGRAVLTIKSSLPDMEVFGMLRATIPGSPLTNLSYGAHGFSCEQ